MSRFNIYKFISSLVIFIILILFSFFIKTNIPFFVYLVIALLLSSIPFLFSNKTLNIKNQVVGNGQYGTSRFATSDEEQKTYDLVPFGKETKSGLVIGIKGNCWQVDTSDQSALMVAPPGAGKSTRVFIPNNEYNSRVVKNTNKAISFILTDCKGDLYRKTKVKNESCGIKTQLLDFRNPLYSLKYNLMYNINKSLDEYKSAINPLNKIKSYAQAEKYAKILSNSIVCNLDTNDKSEASEYFKNTAQGLITALLLLVSEYGEQQQRHIISVFRLIIELNGLDETSNVAEGLQKSKMEKLLTYVENDRLKYYSGASIKADVRTTMNIFSTALNNLANFIDIELEQMICGHNEEISAEKFIESSHAIYLVCPDENTTRHFFASLFIRNFSNELINLAETKYAHTGGRLPCDFFYYLDEFGQMPPIKDIATLFTAIRSRGGRILVGLQSLAQLEKTYSRETAKTIKDACQMLIFTYLSPLSKDTAKEISDSLGTQTVLSGSVTTSQNKTSSNKQMISRPLLFPHEIINLKQGNFVIMKSGTYPIKTKLPYCYDYIEKTQDYDISLNQEIQISDIDTLTIEKIRVNIARKKHTLSKGMFD